MSRYFYDLHIHSCLSPCGDNDMTPANICGMAALKGLNIVALTDHNTCGNCKSFMHQAKANGLIGVAGMELTTSEEIHMVCLFEFLEQATDFSAEVRKHRMEIRNKEEIFGEQLLCGKDDEVTGRDEFFLPAATDLSLEEGYSLASSFGGLCFPAHIDRTSNGIVGILGTVPDSPDFTCIEYHDRSNTEKYEKEIPNLSGKRILVNSDAHYLWDINEAQNYIELDDEPYSSAYVRKQLFSYLKSRQ